MRLLILLALAVVLHAEGPDLKRNQRVQKKAARVLAAQADYNGEMKAWLGECEAKGLTLAPVAGNLMDCVRPQQPPQAQIQRRGPLTQQSTAPNSPNINGVEGNVTVSPAPLATPSEPSSKVDEQKKEKK